MAIRIENLYYLLAYAGLRGTPLPLQHHAAESTKAPFEWLVDLLTSALDELARKRLHRGYAVTTEVLAIPRGTLDLLASERRAHRPRGKLQCTYDDFSIDTPVHRALKATLSTLLRAPTLGSDRLAQLKKHLRSFAEVAIAPQTRETFSVIRLDATTKQYRFALELCELLQSHLTPTSSVGDWAFPDFLASDQELGHLFEAFLRAYYAREQHVYRVTRRSFRWDESPHRTALPALNTDATLESPTRILHIEAKCYGITRVKSRFGDGEKVRSAHLAQLAAYLTNAPETTKQVHGLLVYAVDREPAAPLRFDWRGHRIHVLEINLASPWQRVATQLNSAIHDLDVTRS